MVTVEEKRTFCRLCAAVCGLVVTVEDGRPVGVRGDREHPVSRGYTCPKGRSLLEVHASPARLDVPEMGVVGGPRKPTTWPEVLDDLAERTNQIIRETGPNGIGAYFGSGAGLDGAGNRVARKFIYSLGTHNVFSAATVDAPCRPYVAELVTGNPLTFGRAVDLHGARLTLLVGLNPLVSHGHNTAFPNPRGRLRQLLAQGEVWVADPRTTETARFASRHLAPRPGTDHVWLAAVIRELVRDPSYDVAALRERAWQVDELLDAVAPYDLDGAARRCGLAEEDLRDLVAAIQRVGRISVVAGTGVSMHAAANVTEWLTWALSIVTDSLDEPGGTWCNPGYLKSMDQQDWAATDAVPGPGPSTAPQLPRRLNEYPAAALASQILSGELRGLFLVGSNPLSAVPETGRLRAALQQLDFLAVADIVRRDAVNLATHVLPCADSLERADLPVATDTGYPAVATQYTAAIVPPSAERKPLWWPFGHLGERLGLDVLPAGTTPDTCTDDDVLRGLVRGGRSTFDELRAEERCLVSDQAVFGWVKSRVLPGSRFRLAPAPLVEQLAGLPDVEPALVLVPRRQLRHVNSMLAGADTADGRADRPTLLVHPDDALAAGVRDGDRVVVASRHGELITTAEVTEAIRPGVVSVPHGYEETNVNQLTSGRQDLDPLTGMVRYSALPVEVRPA